MIVNKSKHNDESFIQRDKNSLAKKWYVEWEIKIYILLILNRNYSF